MVEKEMNEPRCGSCMEVNGCIWQGFVYCSWNHCDVWADSIMCDHGKDLMDNQPF